MTLEPVFSSHRPIVVAGPCSAETESQVLATAHALREDGIALFRAGIWKPRTRPGAFEGVGTPGLAWLQRVKQETGLRVTAEVANAHHVAECLTHGIDVLWIGARTTANPFSVQEIAEALRGTNVPVLVKNPISPDLKLWIGAFERLSQVGIRQMAAVHRGFSMYGDSVYRNAPRWQIAIDLMQTFPEMEILCDISHICGRRDILSETAQKAYDLNYDGLMVEVHPTPSAAWSDAEQQITPEQFRHMMATLIRRALTTDDPDFLASIENCRRAVDEIDEEIIALIARRMQLVRDIGLIKKEKNIAVLQPERFRALREALLLRGQKNELSQEFITLLLEAIHQESISQQERVINQQPSLSRAPHHR